MEFAGVIEGLIYLCNGVWRGYRRIELVVLSKGSVSCVVEFAGVIEGLS